MNGDLFEAGWIAITDVHSWHFALFLGTDGAHGLHFGERNHKRSLLWKKQRSPHVSSQLILVFIIDSCVLDISVMHLFYPPAMFTSSWKVLSVSKGIWVRTQAKLFYRLKLCQPDKMEFVQENGLISLKTSNLTGQKKDISSCHRA